MVAFTVRFIVGALVALGVLTVCQVILEVCG